MSDFLRRLDNLEPARVRAAWAAIVALIVAVGVTNVEQIDGIGQAAIVAVFTLLPILQGETTRARVTPTFKVVEAEKVADMEAEIDALNEPDEGGLDAEA